MIETTKWGLSLSGGGARGIIHVGVLKAFDDAGLKPVCISGSSMGAIIGALYAAGISPDKMMELISDKSFLKMFSFRASFSGFLDMSFLKKVIQENLPETFEDLHLPLYVAATNLDKHEPVIFDKGPLHQAVLASASIPVLFAPVEIDGDKYVDGGVLENLPVSACKGHCDKVLGVEVNFGKFTPDLNNMKNVAIEIFHIMVNQTSQRGVDASDSLIRPKLNASFQLLDFSKGQELFDIGFREGNAWLKKNGYP